MIMSKTNFRSPILQLVLLGWALAIEGPDQVNPTELVISRRIQAAFPYYLTCLDDNDSPVYVAEFGKWDLGSFCDRQDPEDLEQLDNHFTVFFYWLLKDGVDHSTGPGTILIADFSGYRVPTNEKVVDFIIRQANKFEEANRKPGLKAIYAVNADEDAFKLFNNLEGHLGSLEGRVKIYGDDSDTWPEELLVFIQMEASRGSKHVSPLQEILDINNMNESLRCNYQYYQLGFAKNGAPVFYGEYGGNSWDYRASVEKGRKDAKALEKYMCQMFLRINYVGEVAEDHPGAIFIANVKGFTGKQTEDYCTAGFLGKVNSFGVNIGRNHDVKSYVIGITAVYKKFVSVFRPLEELIGKVKFFEDGAVDECKAELEQFVDSEILPPECGGPSSFKPLNTFGCSTNRESDEETPVLDVMTD